MASAQVVRSLGDEPHTRRETDGPLTARDFHIVAIAFTLKQGLEPLEREAVRSQTIHREDDVILLESGSFPVRTWPDSSNNERPEVGALGDEQQPE